MQTHTLLAKGSLPFSCFFTLATFIADDVFLIKKIINEGIY